MNFRAYCCYEPTAPMARPVLDDLLRGSLSHSIDDIGVELALKAILCDLARQSSAADFFQETCFSNGALPIRDVVGFELEHGISRVFRTTSMDTVAKVAKPG